MKWAARHSLSSSWAAPRTEVGWDPSPYQSRDQVPGCGKPGKPGLLSSPWDLTSWVHTVAGGTDATPAFVQTLSALEPVFCSQLEAKKWEMSDTKQVERSPSTPPSLEREGQSSPLRFESHYLCNCIWLFCTNFVSMLVIETMLMYLVVFTLCPSKKCVQTTLSMLASKFF